MIRSGKNLVYLILVAGGIIQNSNAALTWPGCTDATDAQFKVTTLVNRTTHQIDEPMKMAFDLVAGPGEDAKDKVDIYFTERMGKVRKFDAKQNKVITLGTLDVNPGASSSDGVLGIALDPAFKTNRFVYLYYTFQNASESSWRISRFTLNATKEVLDLASEKIVLKVPIKVGSQHPGGALQFDAYGDLWITTGNDWLPGTMAFPIWSSGNTNDLRGKILRIHPTADGNYTIPTGNLFPPGTAQTKPEIYVMGTRNAYTLTLDPVRRWATWGDIGPDAQDMDGKPMNTDAAMKAIDRTEEHNIALAPGNFGYPFFAGARTLMAGINAAKPIVPAGTDWGGYPKGLDTLPPAVAAIHNYSRGCAIAGPIYRYDGDLKSSIKFPPHFNRKWFYSDFNGNNNRLVLTTLSADGKSITATDTVLKNVSNSSVFAPLDFQAGPDGALYINNYAGYRTVTSNTSIIRIEYTGTCQPVEPKLETIPTSLEPNVRGIGPGPGLEINQSRGVYANVTTVGEFHLEVRDLMGRPLATRSGRGQTHLALREIFHPGIYFISVSTEKGVSSQKLVIQ